MYDLSQITHVRAWDPGATTGWSLVQVQGVVVRGLGRVVEPSNPVRGMLPREVFHRRLYDLLLEQSGLGVGVLDVCEQGFVPRKASMISGGLSIQRRIGVIERAVWAPGRPPMQEVPGATWKAGVGCGGMAREAGIRAYKRRATEILEEQGSEAPTWLAGGDQASAVCLGWWAASRLEQGLPLEFTQRERTDRTRKKARERAATMPPGKGDGWHERRVSVVGGLLVIRRSPEEGARWEGWVDGLPVVTSRGTPRKWSSAPAAARALDKEWADTPF